MITIGLDLSINSTGICINDNGNYTYYIITPHITKSQRQVDVISYIEYSKQKSDSENIRSIGECIQQILYKYQVDLIVIEDISLQSHSSSIITLSLLNGYVRRILDEMGIRFIMIPPTSLKKFAVGNGGAKKDVMIDSWIRLDPRLKDVKVKIDDLCDAGFLSVYQTSFKTI